MLTFPINAELNIFAILVFEDHMEIIQFICYN